MSVMPEDSFNSAFERFKTRRQTVKLDGNAKYSLLEPQSTIQYFREDCGGLTSLRFNEDGNKVVVGFNSGELQLTCPGLIDRSGGADVIKKGWPGNYNITCIRFHPQQPEVFYASDTAGNIYCCKLNDDIRKRNFTAVVTEENNEINSFDFNPKSTRLVTGGSDAVVRIYDTTQHKMVHEYSKQNDADFSIFSDVSLDSLHPHSKRIYCVRWHPEHDSIFVTGGWDKVIKIWDFRVGDFCVKSIVGPYIFGEAIDIWKDFLLTASCVDRNSLELWDLGSGYLLKNIVPRNKQAYLYGEFPYVAQFFNGDPARNLVLAGIGQRGLQVIGIKEEMIMYLMEDDKTVLAVDSVDDKFAFGGKSNTLMFANIAAKNEVYTLTEGEEDDTSSFYTKQSF